MHRFPNADVFLGQDTKLHMDRVGNTEEPAQYSQVTLYSPRYPRPSGHVKAFPQPAFEVP
jgi:hypothetical protein